MVLRLAFVTMLHLCLNCSYHHFFGWQTVCSLLGNTAVSFHILLDLWWSCAEKSLKVKWYNFHIKININVLRSATSVYSCWLPKLIVMCNMVHLSHNALCVSFVRNRGDCDLCHCVLWDSSFPKDGDCITWVVGYLYFNENWCAYHATWGHLNSTAYFINPFHQ